MDIICDKYKISSGVLTYVSPIVGDEFVVPEGVRIISRFSFSSCKKLYHVVIPNTVTKISTQTFAGCPCLTSIDIPESVIEIEKFAFTDCEYLKEVYIPNMECVIENEAFHSNTIVKQNKPLTIKVISREDRIEDAKQKILRYKEKLRGRR